jgi:RNA polymerase sigma factor (sigma-70 family)
MATTQMGTVLRHIRRLAGGAAPERTDRQLLDDFAGRRDEAAFAALIARHGEMVLRVCRRVLGHEQDAEDAFQATFLVLARNTASIRQRETLAGWLHGVAHRTAMKAKRTAARRRRREGLSRSPAPASPPALMWEEVRTVLDEEVGRLADPFRSAFVLCVLEGKTGPEVAAVLGCKEATVYTRMNRARRLLQKALAARGIELASLLGALAIAEGAAQAAPAALIRATVGFGLLVAAGEPAADVIPVNVAALATGVTRAMFLSKAKIVTAVLVVVSLFATGAGVLAHQVLAARQRSEETQKSEVRSQKSEVSKEKPEPAVTKPPPAGDKDSVAYGGQVIDPDGKPVAGARVYVLYYTPNPIAVPERGTSDKDGRFQFRVARADFDRSSSAQPWDEAVLVARADGYGLAMQTRGAAGMLGVRIARLLQFPGVLANWTLQCVPDDVPITGRILDLQGKPLAGATVTIEGLYAPPKGDLSPFLRDLKEQKLFFPALRAHLEGFEGWIGRDVGGLLRPAVTATDGRFRIPGVGRERLVALRIAGPTLVTQDVYCLTRATPTLRPAGRWNVGDSSGPITVHGVGFDQVAAPCKPIIGVVRDRDTGQPIAGAVVTSYRMAGSRVIQENQARAVADKEGRYRLTGLPKVRGNVIRAAPPEGQPYLMVVSEVGDSPGLEPVTVDFRLKRGVWITGRVRDKVTGKPVHAQVEYAVFDDNPNRKAAPGLTVDMYMQTRAVDGSFKFPGLPGRGLVGARAWDDRYRRAVGAEGIKGLEANGHFRTYPYLLLADNFHTLVEINPAEGDREVVCDVVLDPGQVVKGTVLDADGKPLAGARVAGLNGFSYWPHEPLKTADFTLTGLGPGETRLLQFSHPERRLAGFVVVKGDTRKPLRVQLGPAAVLTGRLVTPDGQPVKEGEIMGMTGVPQPSPGASRPDLSAGTLPGGIRPDKDGKFRIEGIVPGLTYRLSLLKGNYALQLQGAAADPLTVKPGETKDLGDIPVQPME